ncbi:MAG: DEAD/DEAH box helicase, partial [Idiomarinaceae bacterium]|nr:DEAD/DEAH box helicase [Idiomarinaceae bacterium]
MTEDQLEQQCLEWFAEDGWEVAHGPDIAHDGPYPERVDYKQILLFADLEAALRRINPHLPESAIEQVVAVVRKPDSLDCVVNNREFHRLLIDGVPVEYKKQDKVIHDRAFLMDFGDLDANRFRAINQFTIEGSKQRRRPDIICFINGLPVAVIELKSPSAENVSIWDAFNQIQTYKDEIPDLFAYNEALVISDGYNARVGSLTANQERFMPWRTVNHEDDKPLLEWRMETMVRGFFKRELLLDYIRYFVIFE